MKNEELRLIDSKINRSIIERYVQWNNPHYSDKQVELEVDNMLYFFENHFVIQRKDGE